LGSAGKVNTARVQDCKSLVFMINTNAHSVVRSRTSRTAVRHATAGPARWMYVVGTSCPGGEDEEAESV